jgi:hypothetical protein
MGRPVTPPFIAGPISLGWFKKAAGLPGSGAVLKVALMIHYQAGFGRYPFKFGYRFCKELMSKRTYHAAMAALRDAGLIEYGRRDTWEDGGLGTANLVQILAADESEEDWWRTVEKRASSSRRKRKGR